MFILSRKLFLVISLLFATTACKEVLYSGLTEVEANEMVAALAAADISADRVRDKDGIYELRVNGDDVAISTVLLKEAGLPRPSFQSLGDVFSASGIIGTPFEQQARYIFAMNEELSRTITEIEGVESARVAVNAPLQDRYNREQVASSASVTIHHEAGFDTAGSVTKIKQIVSHSMPNLSYDDVSVVFFQTNSLMVIERQTTLSGETPVVAAGILQTGIPASLTTFGWLFILIGLLSIILLSFFAVPMRFFMSPKVSAEAKERTNFTGRS